MTTALIEAARQAAGWIVLIAVAGAAGWPKMRPFARWAWGRLTASIWEAIHALRKEFEEYRERHP